jgi:hypothetical protein
MDWKDEDEIMAVVDTRAKTTGQIHDEIRWAAIIGCSLSPEHISELTWEREERERL